MGIKGKDPSTSFLSNLEGYKAVLDVFLTSPLVSGKAGFALPDLFEWTFAPPAHHYTAP